jgi:anti-sigma-K factor RskA
VDKDIGQLLSWYVNGTLTGPDRDRVEAALRNEAGASTLLEWEKSLSQAVKNDPSLEIAEDRNLDQVMQRIRAELNPAAAAAKKPARERSRFLEWFQWSPALAVACGVVAIQFGIMAHMWTTRGEEGEYSGVRSIAANRSQVYVRVTFKPESTEIEMRELIRSVGAEIVSGPSQLGDYYLIIANKTAPQSLSALQSSPNVESAELVNALPSRPS